MPTNNNQDLMPYHLFYCDGTVLAQNIDDHIIALGEASLREGLLGYQIDGADLQGANFNSAEAMLEDIGDKLDFLFLDGQFTSLPDVSEQWRHRLEQAPMVEIGLHELEGGTEDENAVPLGRDK